MSVRSLDRLGVLRPRSPPPHPLAPDPCSDARPGRGAGSIPADRNGDLIKPWEEGGGGGRLLLRTIILYPTMWRGRGHTSPLTPGWGRWERGPRGRERKSDANPRPQRPGPPGGRDPGGTTCMRGGPARSVGGPERVAPRRGADGPADRLLLTRGPPQSRCPS